MPKKLMTFEEARLKAGIKTETEMAKKLGISKATYQLKESYDRQFKESEFLKFCDVCNVDPRSMLVKIIIIKFF